MSISAPPTYRQALVRMLESLDPPDHARAVYLDHAPGAILDEPVLADRDLPPFDRATMDGYALCSADLRDEARSLRVVGTVGAGSAAVPRIGPGSCCRIATGAPVPPGADAVVQHERTDRGDPVVRIDAPGLEKGANIHRRGEDARAGDVIVERGTRLGPQHLAIAASAGATTVRVSGGRPRARVLGTGDEVRPPETALDDLQAWQIRESNSTLLRHALPAYGAVVTSTTLIPDEPDRLGPAVASALDEADIVVTTGGISAGHRDFLPQVFEELGIEPIIRGVAMQPGKPVFVGVHPASRTWVFALPGNPVSVLCTSVLLLWPGVLHWMGRDPSLPWCRRTLVEPVRPNARREAFRPAALVGDEGAEVIGWRGSGDLCHTGATDALVRLDPGDQPVPAGTEVDVLMYPWKEPGL